jgi:hypothetical protein
VIASSRKRPGKPIAGFGALIAAVCRSHGAALATRNASDFDGTGTVFSATGGSLTPALRQDQRLLPHVEAGHGPSDDHALDLGRALENGEAHGGMSSFRR